MTTTKPTTTNATAATQAVTPRPNYRIFDRTGGGVTRDIYVAPVIVPYDPDRRGHSTRTIDERATQDATLAEAIRQGRAWIEDGDWSGIGRPESEEGETYETHALECSVVEIVYTPDLTSIEALPGVYDVTVASGHPLAKDGEIVATVDVDALPGLAWTGRKFRVVDGSQTDAEGKADAVCIVELPGPIPMVIDDDATLDGQWHDCSGQYTPDMPECEVNLPSEPPYESADGTVTEWESDACDQGHVWRTPSSLLGEFSSHSHGGTGMSHSSVCALCGKYRTEHSPGCQRNPDEALSSITIKDRDEASEAWLKETHEQYGFLPAWLAEMLDCSPSTRMTKEQADEYVAEHTDEDTLDEDDLEHAFAAMFGRRADDKDRAEGLWSHLCA